MKNKWELYALAPLILVCTYCVYESYGLPAHDFSNYYFGAKFLAEGHFSQWVYFPHQFNQAIAAEGYRGIFASYAPNTPFLAFAFLPFSMLPLVWSKCLFNLLSVLLLVYAVRRLAFYYKIPPIYVVLLPLVFLIPIRNGILFGQVYFLLFYLLAESWLAYRQNKMVRLGIFLSFAVLLKIFPVLLVLVFVFQKKAKPLVAIALCGMVLWGLSVLFSSLDVWVFFMESVLKRASEGDISDSYIPNYQSAFMFLKTLLIRDGVDNPGAFFDCPWLFGGLLWGFKILVLAIGYYVSRKIKLPLFTISYWILAMILLSPYGSTYTYILLVFAFFALAQQSVPAWKRWVGIALLFLIGNIPSVWFLKWAFPMNYLRFGLSLLFLLLFLTMCYDKIKPKPLLAITGLAMSLFSLLGQRTPVSGQKLLDATAPILIYDYKLDGTNLTYFYWDEKGENFASIPFKNNTTTPVSLRNGQIYYGGNRLTSDPSNKQKPVVIDGKTLLYLSDEGKGIGFYSLRQLPLLK